MRTIVAPCFTATGQSPDIPMDKISKPSTPEALILLYSVSIRSKSLSTTSISSVFVAIPIRPRMRIPFSGADTPSETHGHPRPCKREGPAAEGCGRGLSEAKEVSEGVPAPPSKSRISSSENPCLVSSAPRWSSRRTSTTLSFSKAHLLMASSKCRESTDWTRDT